MTYAMGNPDKAEQLRERTRRYAIGIVRFCRSLPKAREEEIIGRQLLRSGTSVAANYRAACRSRSRAEFVAKIGTVVEEADEAAFWLELLQETRLARPDAVAPLLDETTQLLKIFSASRRTAKAR